MNSRKVPLDIDGETQIPNDCAVSLRNSLEGPVECIAVSYAIVASVEQICDLCVFRRALSRCGHHHDPALPDLLAR